MDMLSRTKWLPLLAAVLLLTSCGKNKSDLSDLCMVGKVKQITENQYVAIQRFDKVEKGDPYRADGDWDQAMKFDENGNLTETTQFATTGEKVGHSTFVYDKKNPQRKLWQYDYDADGKMANKTQINYDDKLDEVKQYIQYDVDGNVTGSQYIEYSPDKKVRTTSEFSGGGALQDKIVEELDGSYPVSTKIISAKDALTNYHTDVYSHGLRDSTIAYDPQSGKVLMRVGFTYDKNGNQLTQTGVDGGGEAFLPEHWEYEYDQKGNWTRCVHFVGEKPVTVTERFIEYYK